MNILALHQTIEKFISKGLFEEAIKLFQSNASELFQPEVIAWDAIPLMQILKNVLQCYDSLSSNCIAKLYEASSLYYLWSKRLKKINISTNDETFQAYGELTFYNATLEDKFHSLVYSLATSLFKKEKATQEECRSALEWLDKSIERAQTSTAKRQVTLPSLYEAHDNLTKKLQCLVRNDEKSIDTQKRKIHYNEHATHSDKKHQTSFEQESSRRTTQFDYNNNNAINLFGFLSNPAPVCGSVCKMENPVVPENTRLALVEFNSSEEATEIFLTVIKNLDKAACADIIRELARFCRSNAHKSETKALVYTAQYLYRIASDWGDKHAEIEYNHLKSYSQKNLQRDRARFIPWSFSQETFETIIVDAMSEIEALFLCNTEVNVNQQIFEHFAMSTRLTGSLKEKMKACFSELLGLTQLKNTFQPF